MRTGCLVILIFSFLSSAGQNFSYPVIKKTGKTINDFIPSGWAILDKAKGDLNNDKLMDAAVILQRKQSVQLVGYSEAADTITTKPRILIILFKNTDNQSYQLAEQSNTFILLSDSPDLEEPYQSIKIEKGILDISFQLFYNMGSWEITNGEYKFHYQNKQFLLIGAENYSMNRASGEYTNYSYNFTTRKRILTKGGHKMKTITVRKSININPKSLTTFKKPFTWEIEKDVFL